MTRILQAFLVAMIAMFATQANAMFVTPDWFDPTQPGVGTNRYSYCSNDPINCIDPNGNEAYPVSRDIGGFFAGAHSSIAIVTDDPTAYPDDMRGQFVKMVNTSGSVPGIEKGSDFFALTIGGQNSSNKPEWERAYGSGKLIGIVNDPNDITGIEELASGKNTWSNSFNSKFYEKLEVGGISRPDIDLDVEIFKANKNYENDLTYEMFGGGEAHNCHGYCAGLAQSLNIKNYPTNFKGYDPGTNNPVPSYKFRVRELLK